MNDLPIAAEMLREIFNYDEKTGLLTRAVNRKAAKAGQPASTHLNYGYKMVSIGKRKYREHRLVWLYVYGTWPKAQIDHIDGDRQNNAIANLREATNAENHQNKRKPRVDSASGIMGVRSVRGRGKWRAEIRVEGKMKHLGCFDSAEDAGAAFLAAKRVYHAFNTL